MSVKGEQEPLSGFPRGIAIGLISVGILISMVPLTGGFSSEELLKVFFQLVKTFIALPLIFVVVGLLLRLLDKSFNLWNMYYCGVFMSTFFALKGLFI